MRKRNNISEGPKPAGEPSLHSLGVVCALVAGAWLGAAEAPTKLVELGLSPFAISLCMVIGVFLARWTFPTLLKGTSYIFRDLNERRHLIVWAILAGGLWGVANTLTVIAIRDVGLAIAFPLWNANALVGLIWGRVFFGELKGATPASIRRVLVGALAVVFSATLLGFSSIRGGGSAHLHSMHGILAALGACLLWGTMYIPYRKAYISGMNPLSFVTAFTFGELTIVAILAVTMGGGVLRLQHELQQARHVLFWLFLGGFLWVIGDLFQQFAAKYLGIGRGIPLTSTNQLWGLAWASLVFGELRHASWLQRGFVLMGSVGMIAGAFLLASAVASAREITSRDEAILRECDRYNLDFFQTLRAIGGGEHWSDSTERRWWDVVIMLFATAFFLWFARTAAIPSIALDFRSLCLLVVVLIVLLTIGAVRLWRDTNFS